jgi:hypothetical protein
MSSGLIGRVRGSACRYSIASTINTIGPVLMAQDKDLDLVGGVGAGVEHYPAQQLREHLVDQLHRHRRIMPSRSSTARRR